MSMVVAVLARQKAIKIIKQQLKSRGIKLSQVQPKAVKAAANDYLYTHPELIEEVKRTVQLVPEFRTLWEKEQRELRRIRS